MPSLLHELGRRNVIRVVIAYCIFAWVVAQVADLAFESFGAPDWVMQALLVALAIGVVIAAIFAWVFELTPEGLKKDTSVTSNPSFAKNVRRKLNTVIIAVLSLAVVVLLVDKFWLSNGDRDAQTAADTAIKSIAVLPFSDLSPQGDQEYFADGIAEELLNALVKVKTVRVSSRTSSFAFKGQTVSVPEIAERLNVDHIVEGSVRKEGNRLRISAQLVDVSSDSQLWSETYEQTLDDVFEIQDEIAHRIVEALRVAMSDEDARALDAAPRATQNEEALQLFFRANYLLRTRAPENILTAIELYQQALDIDPEFARARAAMATAHMTYPTYMQGAQNWPELYHERRAMAERAALLALEKDDSLAQAYAVLGDIARTRGQWQSAERFYRQALASEPNDPTANLWYVEFLNDVGHASRAVEYAQKAYSLDPMSPGANSNYVSTLMHDDRCQEIGPYASAAAELGNFFGRVAPMLCAAAAGNLEEVADYLAEFEQDFERLAKMGASEDIRGAASDPARLDDAITKLKTERPPGAPPDLEVLLLASQQRAPEALEILLNYEPIDWAQDISIVWWQGMQSVRAQPGFQKVLEAAGLLDYYRATERWPDGCTPTDDGISC